MIQIRKDKREEAMLKKRRCARGDDAREASRRARAALSRSMTDDVVVW
jgi:hypothetical protein